MKTGIQNLIACIVLVLSLSFAASAQTAGAQLTEDQKKALKTKMEAFKAELKLTAEQQPKFEAVNLQFFEELAKLKQNGGSRLSKYRKLKAVTNDRNKKVKDLLTAEQYRVFQAHQTEMKDEMKSRRSQ